MFLFLKINFIMVNRIREINGISIKNILNNFFSMMNTSFMRNFDYLYTMFVCTFTTVKHKCSS